GSQVGYDDDRAIAAGLDPAPILHAKRQQEQRTLGQRGERLRHEQVSAARRKAVGQYENYDGIGASRQPKPGSDTAAERMTRRQPDHQDRRFEGDAEAVAREQKGPGHPQASGGTGARPPFHKARSRNGGSASTCSMAME